MTTVFNTIRDASERARPGVAVITRVGHGFHDDGQDFVQRAVPTDAAGYWETDLPPGQYAVLQKPASGEPDEVRYCTAVDSAEPVWLFTILDEAPGEADPAEIAAIRALLLEHEEDAEVHSGAHPDGPTHVDTLGLVASDDVRLSDERVPTDESVTEAKLHPDVAVRLGTSVRHDGTLAVGEYTKVSDDDPATVTGQVGIPQADVTDLIADLAAKAAAADLTTEATTRADADTALDGRVDALEATAHSSHAQRIVQAFSKAGALTVAAGTHRWYADEAWTIVEVRASVGTAPTGAALIVDVNKNGTTIFTTQGNRPQIAVSGFTDGSNVPDVTSLADGDYLTVDIDQIGSTVAGSDLTVQIVLERVA